VVSCPSVVPLVGLWLFNDERLRRGAQVLRAPLLRSQKPGSTDNRGLRLPRELTPKKYLEEVIATCYGDNAQSVSYQGIG
jgi:hypothetical protein